MSIHGGDCEVGSYSGSLEKAEANMIKRVNPSHMEILESKKTDLERQLNQVNEAIESLKAHPEVVDVLDKLSKVIGRL